MGALFLGASHPAGCWLALYSCEALSLARHKGTVEAVRRIFGRASLLQWLTSSSSLAVVAVVAFGFPSSEFRGPGTEHVFQGGGAAHSAPRALGLSVVCVQSCVAVHEYERQEDAFQCALSLQTGSGD